MSLAAVLAADVGNSKTDVALVAADGSLVAAVRGPTASHQAVGLGPAMASYVRLVEAAVASANAAAPSAGVAFDEPVDSPRRPLAELGVHCAAGADFRRDEERIRRAIEELGLTGQTIVRNDTFAALRAGSRRGWGVAVVCGAGINCVGRAPDGRLARFPAVGDISGDWGGGHALGMAALGAAVRGRDGRGARTALEQVVPGHFGLVRPVSVTRALYDGRLSEARLAELAPLVFATAATGDRVAAAIVDRLGDEVAAWAVAAIRRLRLRRLDPDVVLAGGVFRSGYEPLVELIRAAIVREAPGATVLPIADPPVLGAALIGLDVLSAGGLVPESTERRLRASLSAERLAATTVEA